MARVHAHAPGPRAATRRGRERAAGRLRRRHPGNAGLHNRYEFERSINDAIDDARATGAAHALIYFDLDQFKVVNDTCGHRAGDELLRQLPVVLQQAVRETDLLARLGGDECGIPPKTICFEITETAAVANLAQTREFIRELKARGCRFALDDFGAGVSSFAYLKNLPVDYLKIDGGFVRDMLEDPIDAALVASINHIGHELGIATIAEFVENDEVFGALQVMGVDFVQGFGVARPEPLSEMEEVNRNTG